MSYLCIVTKQKNRNMKKIILTIMFALASCLAAESHPFEKGFGYELPLQFQFGISHAAISQPFKNSFYNYKAQSEFAMHEWQVGFMYFAYDVTPGNGSTDMNVYGYSVHAWTNYSRIGVCLGGVHWIGNNFLTTQSLMLTLFTSSYSCGAGDGSNNLIGWTQEMCKQRNNFKNERKDFGIKIDYNIGVVGVSLINSTYETTLSLHVNFGAKDITKLCLK